MKSSWLSAEDGVLAHHPDAVAARLQEVAAARR
jgi:hypothetical protein